MYRMHPLIPDDFSFRSLADDAVLQERTLEEIGVLHVRERLTEMSMGDLLYSFGTSHPARSRSTTIPASCRTSTAPTGRTSTLPRSTSCGCASEAYRATTSSAGCST